MPDKSTSSESTPPSTPTAAVTEAQAPARKIYPIVKYGDPVLEKATAVIKNFDAELEQLTEDMFASMYAAQGVGLSAPKFTTYVIHPRVIVKRDPRLPRLRLSPAICDRARA